MFVVAYKKDLDVVILVERLCRRSIAFWPGGETTSHAKGCRSGQSFHSFWDLGLLPSCPFGFTPVSLYRIPKGILHQLVAASGQQGW